MKTPFLTCRIGEYAVIVNKKNEVLIMFLPKTHRFRKEMWTLPGGRLNTKEDAGDALKREVKEETGLKIKMITPVYTARSGFSKPKKYCIFYYCTIRGFRRKVKLSKEHIDYQWIPFSKLRKISWYRPSTKIAIQKTKRFIKKYKFF